MLQSDEWRETLHEMIIFGMLFKAVALDAKAINHNELKLSYVPILESVSAAAERKHHQYRQQFSRMGGKVRSQRTQDSFLYSVLVTFRGEQHEAIYNVEVLKAECQVRLNKFPEGFLDEKRNGRT
ncbi:hypothetical protein [uncultured Brevibacillus sp.]|uniref:hypothetical protein n=1 Tax=uncultured Brevibacillus sp. TaxID=169970 RepID=UPI0025988D5E|nr:hypothetical protein [uncultured Brevibacillus sp.]